ncbi:MAG: hypothetical protein U0T82_18295 [Bacteroidales bacterium]
MKAASYFLNYLVCQKTLRNMDISGYCSAIGTKEIVEALSDSTLEATVNVNYFFGTGNEKAKLNPVQYPDSSVINRCVLLHDFLDKNDKMLEMWSRVKGQ